MPRSARELEQQNVERLVVDKNNNLTLFLKDGTTLSYKLYSLELFREDFNELIIKQWQAGILADYDYPPDPTPSPWMSFLPYLAIFVIFGFMWYFMFLRQNGAGGRRRQDRPFWPCPGPGPWQTRATKR